MGFICQMFTRFYSDVVQSMQSKAEPNWKLLGSYSFESIECFLHHETALNVL